MANTFKVVTFAAEPASAGTAYKMYTVAGSTTTVVLGLMLCNVDTSQRLVDVHIESDTSDTETNSNVHAIKDAPIPAGSTLEVMGGNKVVLQASDVLKIDCDVAAKIDATLSIMEITYDRIVCLILVEVQILV